MKKYLVVICAVLATCLLSACNPSTEDVSDNFVLPQALKDKGCVIYKLSNGSGHRLYALYCPHATTSVSSSTKNKTYTLTEVE